MGSRGPRHLRKTTNAVLDALLKAAEQAWHSNHLPQLHALVDSLKSSPDFDEFFHRSYRELMEIVEDEKLEQKRVNAFGRLVVHCLVPTFEDGTFTRDILPNVFSFIHLVLGDDADKYGTACQELVSDLRDELGDGFAWDVFYEHPTAKMLLWRTLLRIASSFKRYELRKDWFIKLMQYHPTSVSCGPNAFVQREVDHTEEPQVFGEREFCVFFHALFTPLKEMAPDDLAVFKAEFGTDPHHLIGDFLVNLASCRV